jgi:epoxyqueuosine reductase
VANEWESRVLETRLKDFARSLGFDLVGIAPATQADNFDRFDEWLERGYDGDMSYMRRHAEARRQPSSILAEVRSVVMVGLSYAENESLEGRRAAGQALQPHACQAGEPDQKARKTGRIARYARGPDYHTVLRTKLDGLLAWLQNEVPGRRGRAVVDTAPLLERDFARRAGLGWFGKNTMLINKRRGSYLYLGALLVDFALQADPPHSASHCGTCTACLDACPTQAFAGPGWLDSRRCISYLTIELRSSVPEPLRSDVGPWLFGCDVCQEVCPWNAKRQGALSPEIDSVDPVEILELSDEDFRKRFRGTALMRAKRRGLARNAAIVLGNVGDESALPALRRAAADPEELIRAAASWAIARIVERQARGIGSTGDFPVAKDRATF